MEKAIFATFLLFIKEKLTIIVRTTIEVMVNLGVQRLPIMIEIESLQFVQMQVRLKS